MNIEKEGELFEQWWEDEGQYHRAGGDDYCKTFAWEAWIFAKTQTIPNGFVSVEDKLPIDGQGVIAFDAIKHCVFKGGEFLQGYLESDTGYEFEEPVEVTHWMAVEAQEQTYD